MLSTWVHPKCLHFLPDLDVSAVLINYSLLTAPARHRGRQQPPGVGREIELFLVLLGLLVLLVLLAFALVSHVQHTPFRSFLLKEDPIIPPFGMF